MTTAIPQLLRAERRRHTHSNNELAAGIRMMIAGNLGPKVEV
jgi:hypothetical protein